MEDHSFFKDLIVVELASVLAGPSVGMFFAELGAKVYKIENSKTGGDVTRKWTSRSETELPSAYYASINYLKETILLDLTLAKEYNKLCQLIKSADIVISNYQPSVAKKLKLEYNDIRTIKDDIILLALDGFSESVRPAFDVVLQAETGWISMTGNGDKPAKLPVALIDVIAGHQLKEAALMAIIHKLKTGEGSYVKCNLEKSSLSALANQATNYLMNGEIAKPIGTHHPNIAPYGDCYSAADGIQFVLAIGSDAQFEALWNILDLRDEVKVNWFQSNNDRLKNRVSLNENLQSAISKHQSRILFKAFESRKVPYGKIKNLGEVLESETAKSMTLEENQEGRNTSRLSSIAFTASFFDNP